MPSIEGKVMVMGGTEEIKCYCRVDDEIDESIVSSKFAERVVINEIEKMTKINKVTLQVLLKPHRRLPFLDTVLPQGRFYD